MTDPSASTGVSPQAHAELALLYQDAVANIRFAKRQQWAVTNYGMLIYAAMIAVSQLEPWKGDNGIGATLGPWFQWAPVAVAAIGIWMLVKNQGWIFRRRLRLAQVHRYFGPEFHFARGDAWQRPSFLRDGEFPLVLAAILFAGAAFVSTFFGLGGFGFWAAYLGLALWALVVVFRARGKTKKSLAAAGLAPPPQYY